ncbi:MAG: ATP-binding protein [Bacteroidaceae bacterium]|nr:ATP-binding protein [Bacteroidaceae bacterium]
MKTSKYRYPVDTDQFQEIREQDKLYIDKTDMMYDLANRYSYVFLARPRRFGKTLLCNTFKAYFQGQKELFEGLKVMELESEWNSYPVLHFDMSLMRNCNSMDGYREALSEMLAKYERQYNTTKEAEEFGTRFHQLLRHIHDTQHQKVVVIIDEYDTPMMRNLYHEEILDNLRTMLRGFYQTVKLDGAYLRFVFVTGVTKFSQLSIFSELNNLYQISMLDDYSGICGITQEELDTVLRPCVKEYAENLNITLDEAYTLLKKNYDGYHFSPQSKDVYAPFSLLRALNDNSTGHYWFESGTMTALIEHLQHYPLLNALDCDGAKVGENEFNISCENAETPLPLLYQSGYLTIDSYNPRQKSYILHFPNLEVRQGMISGLMPLILKRTTSEGNHLVFNMSDALFEGNLGAALAALRSYIAKIPYDIITREEWEDKEKRESFYKLLLYMAFSMLNSIVDTEVKSILGRADVVIKTETHVFVLELKVDDTVENALAQIDDKGYAIQYEAGDKQLMKCGISISSDHRNITHWRIADAKGNLIEDKDFLM